MKKLSASLLLAFLLIGCSKVDVTTLPSASGTEQAKTTNEPVVLDVTTLLLEHQRALRAHHARLGTWRQAKKSCRNNIQVPRDFDTIQEAVDNACDGAVITVTSGNYTEMVVIATPGIMVKANGEVTLTGGFMLAEGADNVTIQHFTILIGTDARPGIQASFVTGGRIAHNTISDPARRNGLAISFINGSNSTIHGNTISGTGWGISFSTTLTGRCHKNTIANNYLTGLTFASLIGLQGNCDDNFINENIMENNETRANGGINLLSGESYGGSCDRNNIKNNISSGGYVGLLLFGGTQNKIGPNNTLTNNLIYGLSVQQAATGNLIFNNMTLGNGLCDILNGASDPQANTFRNNTASCTTNL
jgi:hypothetical protein